MKKENKVTNFLENRTFEQPVYLTDYELDTLIGVVLKQDAWEHNKGRFISRIEHNAREKAFYDQWMEVNEPKAGINNGNGILQDLFIDKDHSKASMTTEWKEVITNHERYIVATVIQWLGSNVGMCFLHDALKKVGMKITEFENKK